MRPLAVLFNAVIMAGRVFVALLGGIRLRNRGRFTDPRLRHS
jgi:hypothetical protein